MAGVRDESRGISPMDMDMDMDMDIDIGCLVYEDIGVAWCYSACLPTVMDMRCLVVLS
jgi:hypothetical protein